MHKKRKHKKSGKKKNHVKNRVNGENKDETGQLEDLPYLIKQSDVMGRYIVASRDIAPGSVIISEDALVVGPIQNSEPICLSCHVNIEDVDTSPRCEKCKWPLCSLQCPTQHLSYGHSQEECDILSSAKGTFDLSPLDTVYNAIVPLRCLLLKEKDPEKWDIISTMEAHNDIRKNISQIWEINQKTVVNVIRSTWGVTKFSEEEIHTVCGILEVNCFEIGFNGSSLRALFPTAFLISHDCTPNTGHVDSEFNMTIRNTLPLNKGDTITLSYALTLQPTVKRREHLKESKFFDCACARCSDPTELGTYISALKCQKCKDGIMLPSDPLQAEAMWHCNSADCQGFSLTADNVETLMYRLQREVDAAKDDIEALEHFLTRYENIFHQNNYLILSVKYTLSQMYGKAFGYVIHELTDEQLMRKRQVCEDLLTVLNVIEPGLTRLRAITMYELHAPIMIHLTRQFQTQKISRKNFAEFKTELKKVVKYLKEAREVLGFEPPQTAEGEMCAAAKDALLRMRDWEQIFGRL